VAVVVEEDEQGVTTELEQAAAVVVRNPKQASKVVFITSVTCSAPALPCVASFSDIAVNPEMSTNAIVPSTSRHSRSGFSASHSITSRGTYGVKSVAM